MDGIMAMGTVRVKNWEDLCGEYVGDVFYQSNG